MVRNFNNTSAHSLVVPRGAVVIYGDLVSNPKVVESIQKKVGFLFECCSRSLKYDIYIGCGHDIDFTEPIFFKNLEKQALKISKSITQAINYFLSKNKAGDYDVVFLLNLNWLSSLDEVSACKIFDSSLPYKYLYTEFNKNIDAHYSVDWIWGSPKLVCSLAQLEDFVKNEHERINSKKSRIITTKWPNNAKASIVNLMLIKIYLAILAITNCELLKNTFSIAGSFFAEKFTGFRARIIRELNRREGLMEIHSCLTNQECMPPLYGFSDIGVIFKYFIYLKGLREQLRFLNSDDFYMSPISDNSNVSHMNVYIA